MPSGKAAVSILTVAAGCAAHGMILADPEAMASSSALQDRFGGAAPMLPMPDLLPDDWNLSGATPATGAAPPVPAVARHDA